MVVVDDGEQRRHRSKIMVRRLALQQFDHGAPDTPNVRGRRGARELDDLRGHPVGCPNDLGLLVRSGKSACRHAKVSKLDGAILGGQDVGALDVSVDDTLIMQILQTLQDLRHVHAD